MTRTAPDHRTLDPSVDRTTVSSCPAPAAGASVGRPSTAPSLSRLVRLELRKVLGTRAVLMLLLGALLLRVAITGAVALAVPVDQLGADGIVTFELRQWLQLPLLVSTAVAVLVVTPEWTARTASSTFVLAPRRGRVAAAKTLAATVAALAVWAAHALVSGLAPAVWSARGVEEGWVVSPELLTGTAVLTVLTALTALGLGMLTRSTVAALALAVGLPVAWGLLAFSPDLARALPWASADYGHTLLTGTWPAGEATGEQVAQLLTSTALWVGIPLTAGWWRLTRTDLT